MINDEIVAALAPVGIPVEADIYEHESTTYITFNVDSVPLFFGDNRPKYIKSLIQVHLFAPLGQDVIAEREMIISALFRADFTWPTEANNSDDTGQHYIYECESIEVAPNG